MGSKYTHRHSAANAFMVSFSPAGGANSVPRNPSAGFKGPLRREKEKGKGRKQGKGETKERDWRKRPSEINFWLLVVNF